MDELAHGATLFTAASAEVPLTFPSHVSLLTSTYPFTNNVRDNGSRFDGNLVTLASVLKANGYSTAAFVGGFVLDRRFGLNRGFDVYDSTFKVLQQGGDAGDVKRPGAEVVHAASEWLERAGDQPLFLFLHLYDLHTPYNLSALDQARFGSNSYDAELAYVDSVVGSFWGLLKRRGLADNSLVILTADHGESLGEHGERLHGYFIYQSTLAVPLILHWPASYTNFPARVTTPVALIDVAPTVLQFIRIAPPHSFQGRSLLTLLRVSKPADEAIYSESLYAQNHFGCASLRSLRLGRYKYIAAPRAELYDLGTDPDESRNLYSRQQSVALALRERLLSITSLSSATAATKLSPEDIARLNSLGYVAYSRPTRPPSDTAPDPKDRIGDYERYGRALQLSLAGRTAQADVIFSSLVRSGFDLPDLRIAWGVNRQRAGQYTASLDQFRAAISSQPNSAQAHFDVAVSYFHLQRLDEAVRELQLALMLDSGYSRADELLGLIDVQQKRFGEARQRFQHLLTISPNNYAAHYNLGVLDAIQEHWPEASNHLKLALDANPTSAEAHNALGSVYLQEGEWQLAQSEFKAATQLKPRFAWAHYNLGLVLVRLGDSQGAAREYRLALKADAGFTAARRALARMEQAQ